MREQWGLSPFSIDRLRAGASVSTDGFTLWLENGQVQSCRSLPSEPDWVLDGQPPTKQDQPDEYAVPEGDQDWPMLVELCGEVYQAQGHAGGAPLDRDAATTLSVGYVASAGGTGYAGMDAGTGRLLQGVGMNSKQRKISRQYMHHSAPTSPSPRIAGPTFGIDLDSPTFLANTIATERFNPADKPAMYLEVQEHFRTGKPSSTHFNQYLLV